MVQPSTTREVAMSANHADQLAKTYENGVVGLQELSLSIEPGTIFGLLGPNGAGKSTTVRLLNGTLAPTSGSCRVLGADGGTAEVRARTATPAESARMYEHLTVAENLRFFGALYDMDAAEIGWRTKELLGRLDLAEKADLKLGSFSTGMKKRVQLARTLLHRPNLVFLDEPTSGLDPESSVQVIGLIRRLAEEEGTTVLLCTHNLPLAERVCDAFGFLEDGRLIHAGSREQTLTLPGQSQRLVITTSDGEREISYEHESEINNLIRSAMDEAYFHYVRKNGDGAAASERSEYELVKN
jgi:ABC-2 type transport system ATP-binding protein